MEILDPTKKSCYGKSHYGKSCYPRDYCTVYFINFEAVKNIYCKTCFIQVHIKSIEYHTYKYFYTKILFFPEFCGKNYVLLY